MTSQQIAEAFSRHRFASTYPYFLDTIRWNLIGNQPLYGVQSIIAACEQSAAYLKTVTTMFDKFVVLSTENDIVIDSLATYQDGQQPRSKVASCDWYRFENGKLAEITSYTIEVKE